MGRSSCFVSVGLVATLLLVSLTSAQHSAVDPCAALDCASCANNTACGYCKTGEKTGNCTTLSLLPGLSWPPCSPDTFPCSESIAGTLMLVVIYGAILGVGAKFISDGAEGVLELWPDYGSVIGALLLPVLGALPDSAMIIVSGAFGTPAEAQAQLGVGVGTLAGSTIMLLTVPWTASLFVAACDLNEFGEAIERKRTSWNFFRTGITVDADTRINARIMIVSAASYLIVQGIAFRYLTDSSLDAQQHAIEVEHPFALAGFIVCTVGLVAYCVYQLFVPKLAKQRQEMLRKQREEKNVKLRALFILQHFPAFRHAMMPQTLEERIKANALHFARRWKTHALAAASATVGTAGSIQEDTRLTGLASADDEALPLLDPAVEADEDPDEDDEAPEEDPREHFWKNFLISMALMLGGTGIVAVFSDPMVDTISEIGFLWGVPVFYISFILTPFCSNASELVASIAFASKKRVANTSMTYSQLYGACVMNNTMGLGIFFFLIAFRGLDWTYTAETLAILFVILAVGIPASLFRNFPLWWAFLNAPLYILALVIVYVIENFVGWS